jgi:hypothetical protein
MAIHHQRIPFLAITHSHKATYENWPITCYSVPWQSIQSTTKEKIHRFLTNHEELEPTWSCPVDKKKSFKNSCL